MTTDFRCARHSVDPFSPEVEGIVFVIERGIEFRRTKVLLKRAISSILRTVYAGFISLFLLPEPFSSKDVAMPAALLLLFATPY